MSIKGKFCSWNEVNSVRSDGYVGTTFNGNLSTHTDPRRYEHIQNALEIIRYYLKKFVCFKLMVLGQEKSIIVRRDICSFSGNNIKSSGSTVGQFHKDFPQRKIQDLLDKQEFPNVMSFYEDLQKAGITVNWLLNYKGELSIGENAAVLLRGYQELRDLQQKIKEIDESVKKDLIKKEVLESFKGKITGVKDPEVWTRINGEINEYNTRIKMNKEKMAQFTEILPEIEAILKN